MNLSNEEAQPRVLAVVVTHNGRKWLAECLNALSEQVYPLLDVIVVDSGSNRSAETVVRKLLPDAEFRRIDKNVGFGAAANHGLEASLQAPDADYFLFIHDDSVLEPEALSMLIATALETEGGIVGGKGLDWDTPERLLEVGMTADQFGYPFSGLEEGEIDQGQHDRQRETLFVTNACMLVSRGLIERVGSWDGAYFAFGEDLDLCTRARVAGFKVYVQPWARYRHALALASQVRESPAAKSIRYLTRRNRLRTLAKNSATYRLPFLLLFYFILASAEMAFLSAFRRFDELSAYPRAFFSFFVSLPQVLGRRRAVQKRRAVPDRRIRRLMVRDLHRARVFFEKRIGDWGEETIEMGSEVLRRFSPKALRELLSRKLKRGTTVFYILIVASLAFAMRHALFGPPLASGSLWPYPEETSQFFAAYMTSWRDIGLGSESASPPVFLLLWAVSVISLGKAVLAQHLTIVLLAGIGLVGIARFVSRRTSSAAGRVAAVGVYALGPVTKAGSMGGDLGALALFATLPWLLEILMRMLGPSPSETQEKPATLLTTDSMTRDLARAALITAGTVALAPSALLAVFALVFFLGLHSVMASWDKRSSLRRWAWTLATIPASLVLLLPWSFEVFRPRGAVFVSLTSRGGGIFSPLWKGLSAADSLMLAPSGSALEAGVGAGLLAGVLILVGPARRREARWLISVWLGFGVIGGLAALGLIRPPVASHAMWFSVPLACAAALAGVAVAGLREELPLHALGFRHVMTALFAGLVLAGLLGSWVPGLARWTRAEPAFAAGTTEAAASISSYLKSTAETTGDFRVLWLGEAWIDPIRAGSRRIDKAPYFLTGPDGLTMLDAQEPPPSDGERQLDDAVGALVERRLHLAGHLLAPANIRFVIVDPRDELFMAALRSQRDVALEQQQGGIAIFRNLEWLPRAALAPVSLEEALASGNESALLESQWAGGRDIPQRSPTAFRGKLPRTRHSFLILSENFNSGWRARVGRERLEQAEAFGWANRFDVPRDASGEVRVTFSGRWVRFVWLLFQVIVLVISGFAAGPVRHEIKGWLR